MADFVKVDGGNAFEVNALYADFLLAGRFLMMIRVHRESELGRQERQAFDRVIAWLREDSSELFASAELTNQDEVRAALRNGGTASERGHELAAMS